MISWSTKRKLIYSAIVTAFLAFVIALPIFFVVYDPPTCADKLQNQGEGGVDCGGPCPRLCRAAELPPIVRWWRVFRVQDGIYNLLAYVENPNFNSGALNAPYLFRVYDSDNILIYERKGRTYIPPRKVFGVFESGIYTGDRVPARALFEFTREPKWDQSVPEEAELVVRDEVLKNENSAPRVEAVLENKTIATIENIEVTVIIYDGKDNAIGASKTIVDRVEKGSVVPVVFTWPEAFSGKPARIETLYKVFPSRPSSLL